MHASSFQLQRLPTPIARSVFAQAHWLWVAPEVAPANGTLRFSCEFSWAGGPLAFHLSADQRFQLFLDDAFLCAGPSTGTRECWHFSSYRLILPAGRHRFTALVWCLPEHAPYAHMSVRPGFLFAASDVPTALLDTGRASWTATTCPDIVPRPERKLPGACFIGPSYDLDGRQSAFALELPVHLVSPGYVPVVNGRLPTHWHLANDPLPEPVYQPWRHWRPRAEVDRWLLPEEAIASEWTSALSIASQIAAGRSVTFGPHRSWSGLFDAETILTAYPGLVTENGLGADVELLWCESLGYEAALTNNNFLVIKGHRDEVIGKRCFGEGDHFIPGPLAGRIRWRVPWWRAGRYLLVRIRTQDAPLTLHGLACDETRYPLPPAPVVDIDDPSLARVLRLCENAFRASCHEIYADCPAFEQVMYTGDARIEMLIHRAIESDDRLARKAIQLFNLSRHHGQGWTLSRFPARLGQVIPSYALIWVLMVDDFLHWHNDLSFVRAQLPGVRATLDLFESHLSPNGWLTGLPGWEFIDWTDTWANGVPPTAADGRSTPINLFHLLALQAGARLERACGHPARATLLESLLVSLREQVRAETWDTVRGLFRDAPGVDQFSEHTQVLAVLSLGLTPGEEQRLLQSMRDFSGPLVKCSYYFSHYYFEAHHMAGDDSCHDRLNDWKDLLSLGLHTTIEAFEPTRSDCHGWGAHPLFHLPATFVGLRPSAPQMERIVVRPLPGPLRRLKVSFPWRDDVIHADLQFSGDRLSGSFTLPTALTGELQWAGRTVPLQGGLNPLALPA